MRDYSVAQQIDMSAEILKLEKRCHKLQKEVYSNLTRWQRVQLARHPERPYTVDIINRISTSFYELHGDRRYADDKAIVAGMATIEDQNVMVIGHQKGRGTKNNLYRNFGMPNPEGYRKAIRLMELASKFGNPIVTLIDTPGAYPGRGSEERGVAEAIAVNLREMALLKVPVVCVVVGEGGSGGALAIAVGDRIMMLENSIYSVISPEGCAAILLRDGSRGKEMADALRVTALDLKELGVIDDIIKEPFGGAHRNYDETAEAIKWAILGQIKELQKMSTEDRINERIAKFGRMGEFTELPS